MANTKKSRFGIQLTSASDAVHWRATARRVEDLGFSSLFLPDHFGDQLAPVPALMAAADATTTLRLGALVWDNDYKHPVVLAKEAATIDLLSGGRLEFGIGAGWMNTDYEQSGIVKERDRLRRDQPLHSEGLRRRRGGRGGHASTARHQARMAQTGRGRSLRQSRDQHPRLRRLGRRGNGVPDG